MLIFTGIILWENLHFGFLNRVFRRFISTYIASFWIILSLIISFGAKYKQVGVVGWYLL